MKYAEFVELYEALGKTTKKLEKTKIIADFLPKLKGHQEWIYLLRGRVFPDYDSREFGISTQLTIKAITKAAATDSGNVIELFRKHGDLGDVAFNLFKMRKQASLFHHQLSAEHVFSSLRKLAEIEGDGTVDRKVSLISEVLISATPDEARYLIRTLLNDLRVGVADAILLDAISKAFLPENSESVKTAYDFLTDFALVLEMAIHGKKSFEHIPINPGKPFNVMLAVKAQDFEDAFRICGKPAAFEHKYDGFRVIISYDGKNVKLFTRRLEDVTNQFPDVVSFARQFVNAKNFILDSEVVGYSPKTGHYLPFEAISQRIKRKYDIDRLVKELPVEVNVFDIIYLDGKDVFELPFQKRREILERIVKNAKMKLRLSEQLITDSVKDAEQFYKNALKIGREGVMVKNLNVPYKPGRAVGYMVKIKPDIADLDLVIVGAEYGTGKRAGGLTSFTVACKDGEKFVEIGKVSSGLKEKSSEGTTYKELDDILQPLIQSEDGNSVIVKPKVVVSVTYQNIQPSPTYSSGYALRFPRITHYRPERGTADIATIEDIKREVRKAKPKGKK